MEVLSHIRDLLDKNDMSVYELSKKSNIPQSTLSNMFSKSTYPTIPTLEAICRALNISLSDFFATEIKREQLSLTEVKVLKVWNQLPDRKKNAIKELLDINNEN